MNERPRTLKAMLAEAKDTSELMLDLAYAGLFYADRELSGEVLELEEELSRLVHRMREVCLIASRSPQDAAGLASLLQVMSSIEMIGNNAVDIAKIVLDDLGIPKELMTDLTQADEVIDRIQVQDGSELQGRSVDDLENAVEEVRLIAIRRGTRWLFDPADEGVLQGNDILVVRAHPEGLPQLRRLAGMPAKPAPVDDEQNFWELDKAVDEVVDMKDLAEAAVGLAYAAVLLDDRGLAAEVVRLEDRLDDMRESIESWVLDAAAESRNRPALRGLMHLAVASEGIGDAAQAMVWLIERDEELHPVIAEALGAAEDVVMRVTVMESSPADDKSLGELDLRGMTPLAFSRRGRWIYRPRGRTMLQAGDWLILIGPQDTVEHLEWMFGDQEGET
ncbi:MAG TPA: TrkA C-terminal domain-containing protein [Actinomycetota bacterium]|nr:TrkA C-terminal domain-containing protein [Actinomycetota bacterium]